MIPNPTQLKKYLITIGNFFLSVILFHIIPNWMFENVFICCRQTFRTYGAHFQKSSEKVPYYWVILFLYCWNERPGFWKRTFYFSLTPHRKKSSGLGSGELDGSPSENVSGLFWNRMYVEMYTTRFYVIFQIMNLESPKHELFWRTPHNFL